MEWPKVLTLMGYLPPTYSTVLGAVGVPRKKTKSLEKQAEKATLAKEYGKELEQLDKALNKHEHTKIREELDPLKERIENADKEKKEILAKAKKLEQDLERIDAHKPFFSRRIQPPTRPLSAQQLNQRKRRIERVQQKWYLAIIFSIAILIGLIVVYGNWA